MTRLDERRNRRGLRRTTMLAVAATLVVAQGRAAIIQVAPGQSIQAAIQSANNGDEIHVQPGVYPEAIDFLGKAIRVLGSGGATVTTIDATSAGTSAVTFQTGETGAAILEGFRVTGGAGQPVALIGGGVAVLGTAFPTIRDCHITGNTANQGGGVYCAEASSVSLIGCTLDGNVAVAGGGFYGDGALLDCIVANNQATRGGGIASVDDPPTFQDTLVSGNTASADGGGIYHIASTGAAVLSSLRARVIGNSAGRGGGVFISAPNVVELRNLDICGNHASMFGGGIYAYLEGELFGTTFGRVINCIVANNTAAQFDGAYFAQQSPLAFTDVWSSTVVGNDLTSSASVRVVSSILWGAAPVGPTVSVEYSDVQGGFAGEGNINADPLFVNPAAGDLHIDPALSPCINAGTKTNPPLDVDIDGDPRAQGPQVDMGADEARLDCNGNAIADYVDILSGASLDCDGDGIPDECEPFLDCNGNNVRDECDIAMGVSLDCNGNNIPDECEPLIDCNGNGASDACDIVTGFSLDCNGNGVPDECDLMSGASLDIDGDGVPDECQNILLVPTAYSTIQAAIDAAAPFGDSILVEDGVYSGAGYNGLDFKAKTILLKSRGGAGRCVIDGQDITQLSIVNANEHLIVDGFTLRRFRAQNGAVFDMQGTGSLELRRCVLTDNRATGSGGAVRVGDACQLTMLHCVVYDNLALNSGGALLVNQGSAHIQRSTLFENTASGGGFGAGGGGTIDAASGAVVTIRDSILRGGTSPNGNEVRLAGSMTSVDINYSNVEGGAVAIHQQSGASLIYGANNIDADPQFVGPAVGDVHLLASSPCRDAAAGMVVKDFEGDPGVGAADMGADEHHPHLYHVGALAPGAPITVNVIGVPNASPVLYLLAVATTPPVPTPYGFLLVGGPLQVLDLIAVPASSALVLPLTVPLSTPPGLVVYGQALIGPPDLKLTNLDVLVIE